MNMLSYSILFCNKKLCRAEAFSGIVTNLRKQKLDSIKLKKLTKTCNNFDDWHQFFKKNIFSTKQKQLSIIIEFRIFELY